MEYKQVLNKVRALLSLEVKFEQMTLIDGVTVLEAESFEAGFSVGIVTAEGIIPAPVGVHETTDNMVITVEVEGIIKSVEAKEIEASADPAAPAAADPAIKKVVDTVTKETFFAEVKVEIEKLEAENTALKVELQAVKLELQQAGVKAIVPNPEPKQAISKSYNEMTNFEKLKHNKGL